MSIYQQLISNKPDHIVDKRFNARIDFLLAGW